MSTFSKLVIISSLCFSATSLTTISAATCTTTCQPKAAAITTTTIKIGTKNVTVVKMDMNALRHAKMVLGDNKIMKDVDAKKLVNSVPNAIAAINGSFFNAYYKTRAKLAYPDNAPVNYATLIADGQLINNGGEHNFIGFTYDGQVKINRVNISSNITVTHTEDGTVMQRASWSVNRYNAAADFVGVITEHFNLPLKLQKDAVVVTVKNKKVSAVTKMTTLTTKPAETYIVYNTGAYAHASALNDLPKKNDTVDISFTATVVNDDKETFENIESATSGGLMLVKNGVNVTKNKAYNAEFLNSSTQNPTSVHFRSFIGVTNDNKIVMGTTSNSFSNIANALVKNNIKDAMSLDGGSSAMLYMKNKGFLTPAGRHLTNAIVFYDK